MPTQGRIDKTIDKMRRGGLPAPMRHDHVVGLGEGRPCDGCGETIHPTEMQYTVDMHQTFTWRFHSECYGAWTGFTH